MLFAPDVDVLLSSEFAAAHCYTVVREGSGGAALVGLAFAPAAEKETVDVEGVYWLNARTAELRSLEFGYTGLEEKVDPARHGRHRLHHLPGGLWAVARSWVRTPAPGGDDEYREEGVEVSRVTAPDGAETPVIARAGLVGTVREHAGGKAYEGATVELLGNRTARRPTRTVASSFPACHPAASVSRSAFRTWPRTRRRATYGSDRTRRRSSISTW